MFKLNNILGTRSKGGNAQAPALSNSLFSKFTALFASFMLFFAISYKAAFSLTIDVPTINMGDVVTLTITSTVDSGTAGQTILNVVSHTQDQDDSNTTADDLQEAITVNNPVIGAAKAAVVDGNIVDFTFTLENMGNVDLSNLTIPDNLDAVFGAGNYVVNSVGSSTGNLHNTSFNGSTDTQLANPSATLTIGESQTITVSLTVNSVADMGFGVGNYENQVLATAQSSTGNTAEDLSVDGIDPDPDNDGDPTNNASATALTVELAKKLYVSKVANRGTAQIGDYVIWTITVTNTDSLPSSIYNLTDTLPTGIRYIAGSSAINGTNQEPIVAGSNLTWSLPSLAGGSSAIISIKTILGSRVILGKNVNKVKARDAAGNSLSDTARATVEVLADPTFDCSDLIGKVFEDTNKDGYQDKGEKGIGGAILYTVEGLRISTDRHGRYHVTCAMIPQKKRGSNFIIKLDESSLPEGYNITSENPRVVRLTRGKMHKANFGAYRSRKVNVRLNAKAFASNSEQFGSKLDAGISKLVAKLKSENILIFITYSGNFDEDRSLIAKRIANVRNRLKEVWQRSGGKGKLSVESKIQIKKSASKKTKKTSTTRRVR